MLCRSPCAEGRKAKTQVRVESSDCSHLSIFVLFFMCKLNEGQKKSLLFKSGLFITTHSKLAVHEGALLSRHSLRGLRADGFLDGVFYIVKCDEAHLDRHTGST